MLPLGGVGCGLLLPVCQAVAGVPRADAAPDGAVAFAEARILELEAGAPQERVADPFVPAPRRLAAARGAASSGRYPRRGLRRRRLRQPQFCGEEAQHLAEFG